MGIWNTKFRKTALITGALAISLAAANPALAREPQPGSKRGGVGFASGAVIGAAAGGPIGAFVGASVGSILGERSHKKSEALKQRQAESEKLVSDLENLNLSLA